MEKFPRLLGRVPKKTVPKQLLEKFLKPIFRRMHEKVPESLEGLPNIIYKIRDISKCFFFFTGLPKATLRGIFVNPLEIFTIESQHEFLMDFFLWNH